LGVTGLGFPLFWLPRWPALNLAGLFVAGLGVASLFPFTISVALSLAPQQANTASARVSLGVGVAIFSAPLLLGWAADRLGLPTAFGLVAGLIVAAFGVTLLARRAAEPRVVVPA
jgi:fucose permease